MKLNTESDYRLLPKFLVSKRAILNHKNIDHRSFGYAIMFALNPKDWREDSSKTEKDIHFKQLGLNKIKYPVLFEEIPACEEQLLAFEIMFSPLTMHLVVNVILITYVKSSNQKK